MPLWSSICLDNCKEHLVKFCSKNSGAPCIYNYVICMYVSNNVCLYAQVHTLVCMNQLLTSRKMPAAAGDAPTAGAPSAGDPDMISLTDSLHLLHTRLG